MSSNVEHEFLVQELSPIVWQNHYRLLKVFQNLIKVVINLLVLLYEFVDIFRYFFRKIADEMETYHDTYY